MTNFFTHHGVLVLICLALFPRLTLLFAGFLTGGWLWWVGWIFTPHLLVAILALPYFHTNPVLVVVAWIMAFSGSSYEARKARKYRRR